MNIVIHENQCWICGKRKFEHNLTMHHTLPKHLRPKKNVLVPVCEDCHKLVNEKDIRGLIAFAYKIVKSMKTVEVMGKEFYSLLKTKVGDR